MATLSATIATSAAWPAVSWTAQSSLRLETLTQRVFPGVSQAVVSQHYGYIAETGETPAAVAPVDLAGSFVRVVVSDGTNSVTWYGYCPGGTDTVNKTHADPVTGSGSIPSGLMQWTVFGFEYFLRSMTYDRCVTADGTLLRVLPFNFRRTRGGALLGNRAASPVSGALYKFDAANDDLWTARQAAEHILGVFATQSGISLTLGGQTTALDLVNGAWDMAEGLSYADALRRVINPELGWALMVNGATLTVESISDVAIGDLPANDNVVSLTLESSGAMDRPRVTLLDQAHYDTITVRGEPLRVMMTLSVAGGDLEADWDAALATAYAAETTDAGRRMDKYRTLWARFRIPAAWDGLVSDGGGGAGTRIAIPAIDTSTGKANTAAAQVVWWPEMVLDRTLPYIATTDTQPGEPLVTVTDAITSATVRLDDPPDDRPGATIAVCDDRPGILLRPAFRHLLAYGYFSGSGGKHGPRYDYATLAATVSLYTCDRTRVTVSAVEAEPGQVNREKVIDIPDAHLWLVLKGTATDIGTVEAADRYLRDDTAVLVRAAALAKAWYGRARASIACTYSDPMVLDRLGHVISEVRTSGAIQQAGTMITEITYSLGAGRHSTAFSTELFELRFDSMFGGRSGAVGSHRRMARVEAELANVPVRPAPAPIGWPAPPDTVYTYYPYCVAGTYTWIRGRTCGATPTATPTPTPTATPTGA